jgi:hypothetical protein
MQDYHIMFYGGSGGHICSHLVLQSGQHYCAYDQLLSDKSTFDKTFFEIKNFNWNQMQQQRWRQHHSWPNNELTQKSRIDDMHKMFFTCAPNESSNPEGEPDSYQESRMDHKKYPGAKTVLIWTDIDTQAELARYKQSRWFRRNQHGVYYYWKTYSCFESQWREIYHRHRAHDWPTDISIRDIPDLDSGLIHQMQAVPEFLNFFGIAESSDGFHTWRRSLHTRNHNGFLVERSVHLMLQQSDIVVRLQDVAKSQGKWLTDCMGIPWTNQHQSLVNQWLDLHPKHIKNMLLD